MTPACDKAIQFLWINQSPNLYQTLPRIKLPSRCPQHCVCVIWLPSICCDSCVKLLTNYKPNSSGCQHARLVSGGHCSVCKMVRNPNTVTASVCKKQCRTSTMYYRFWVGWLRLIRMVYQSNMSDLLLRLCICIMTFHRAKQPSLNLFLFWINEMLCNVTLFKSFSCFSTIKTSDWKCNTSASEHTDCGGISNYTKLAPNWQLTFIRWVSVLKCFRISSK